MVLDRTPDVTDHCRAESMREQADAAIKEARPILHADSGDLALLTDQTWKAIKLTNDPVEVFRFGGVPSRIERGDDGAPFLAALTPDRMRHHIALCASWVKGEKRALARPPIDVVRNVLATPNPPRALLKGIVEVPVLDLSGVCPARSPTRGATTTRRRLGPRRLP